MALLASMLAFLGCDKLPWRVLTDADVIKFQADMSLEQGIDLLGKPIKIVTYPFKPQEVNYHWPYHDADNHAMIFIAVFDKTTMQVLRFETMKDMSAPENVAGP